MVFDLIKRIFKRESFPELPSPDIPQPNFEEPKELPKLEPRLEPKEESNLLPLPVPQYSYPVQPPYSGQNLEFEYIKKQLELLLMRIDMLNSKLDMLMQRIQMLEQMIYYRR